MISCLLKNESASFPTSAFGLTKLSWGGTAKASPNRAFMYCRKDPKPGDLSMSRMKRIERCVEVRTRSR